MKEDNREVFYKEIKPQPLTHLVDIVEKPTILRIIVGERPKNVYVVVVLSTSWQSVPSDQTVNNQV